MSPLVFSPCEQYILPMSRDLERWYRETLASLNLAEVARETDRGHRTLHAYMRGERNVTKEAVEQLIKYLRVKSDTFTAAADKMAAALEEEG
jgi:hypothetical protein